MVVELIFCSRTSFTNSVSASAFVTQSQVIGSVTAKRSWPHKEMSTCVSVPQACDRLLAQRVEVKLKGKKVNDVLNRLHLALPAKRDEKVHCLDVMWHTHTHTCMHMHAHTCTHTHPLACTHTPTQTHAHIRTTRITHTYTRTCTHAHVDI